MSLFSWNCHYIYVGLLPAAGYVVPNLCQLSQMQVWLYFSWMEHQKFSSIISRYFPVSSTLYIESPFFLLASWPCMLGEERNKDYFRNVFTNSVSHASGFTIVSSMNYNHYIHFSLTYHSSSTHV